MYISGQLGLDPEKGDLVSGGVEAECRQALQNMGSILKAAGASYNNGKCLFYKAFAFFKLRLLVVKTTVLLANIGDFAKVNTIYAECKLFNYVVNIM